MAALFFTGCLLQVADVEEAEQFFEDVKISKLSFVRKSLESARVIIRWAENNAADVEHWLQNRSSIRSEL